MNSLENNREIALFQINTLAGELKNLFTLLQNSDLELPAEAKAVVYFGVDGLSRIEKLSDETKNFYTGS